MSYQEKKNIVNIIGTLVITGSYFWYVTQSGPAPDLSTTELLKFWAKSMLVLIPVSIAGKIIVHIAFTVVNAVATRDHKIPPTDERDRLIELKSNRNSQFIFGAGFLIAMAALVMDASVTTMFVILILGGVLSEVFDNASQLYFHRRGIGA